MKYSKLSIHFDPGTVSNHVAAILQCPGRFEHDATPQHPAAGKTGRHLRKVLEMVRLLSCKENKITWIDDLTYDEKRPQGGIMVANAHRLPYFVGGEYGKSPPPYFQCSHVRNVSEAITDKKLVVCFGDVAAGFYDTIIAAHCCNRPRCDQFVVKCCHLSFCAINSIIRYDLKHETIQKGDSDATVRRLAVIARYLYDCIAGGTKKSFKEFIMRLGK